MEGILKNDSQDGPMVQVLNILISALDSPNENKAHPLDQTDRRGV